MITQIEHLQMPDWLNNDIFSFDIKEVLTDSLYYPCSHFDGKPVTHLMGNVYSFIYVDYGVSKDDFYNEVNNHGFNGYHTIYSESIRKEQLVPNGWNTLLTPDGSEINRLEMDYIREWIKEPFCEWMIFERDADKDESYNPKRFSLLFMCAEGAAAYQALYLSNNIGPKILAIIRPGSGFGGNYTDFRERDRILARSVFYNKSKLPEYILIDNTSEPLWEEYAESIWSTDNYFSSIKLWRINKKVIMENNLEQLKHQFLNRYNRIMSVELALTSGIKAAVQRNVLYSKNLNQKNRNQIVKSWKKELMDIYQEYKDSAIMNDGIYEQLIIRLKTNMNNNYAYAFNHNKSGYDNGFRISHAQKSISVFLKHLWCMNKIEIPMQCPVDRIILTRVGCSYPDNRWGYINSIDAHREKIEKIKDYCLPQNIAEWELAAF